ncbi:hypothetical protein [Sporosarcina pasteurii]|uniref:Uncharacterized protein n=1 Tax=Sporosarcina pasteurii TaxID=1474 RepID=A0A380BD54_SPOPA|nr:hypothetical protein [Sporosarcina pasteurii]MDS9472573.1 hypothetical protein [Sporosarcina pasteurii]QBQ06126.1 hypothetical protein E2C16_10780 [Sporosarcina pasteurii]SUI99379.1 Uncharacterised protein [Sporosarcina pasteurii]
MHLFDINELKICLNPAELKDDVYVSLSIGIGFLPRRISSNEKTNFIGTASAKMFLNYLSESIKTNHSIETKPIVSMTSSSLLLKTSKTNFYKDVQTVLDNLFTIEIDDGKWLVEKENTLNRFKEHFIDLNFRGRMRMLEFTHANKSFQFEELTKDLLVVKPNDVHTMRESLVYPKNCFLFIHGNVDVDSVKDLRVEKSVKKKVIQLYEPVDIYNLHDEKYEVKSTHGNYTCGSIKFDRSPTLSDLAYEYVTLMLIGQILFKGAYLIEVDPLDASLTYSDKLEQYKHDIYEALTDEQVEQAKKNIYQSLYQELVLYPFQLVEKVGRLHFNGINYFEAMSILEKINYDDIMKFIKERDYKIREGHLRYYREG